MSLGNINVNEYWNAATNTPKLVSGRGIHGQGYIVGVPGTTTLDGVSSWSVGDIVVFILDTWIKLTGVIPAGADGDIQIKNGSALAALSRSGGVSTDYLARDNTYKTIPTGGGGGGGVDLTWVQIAATTFTSPPTSFRTSGYHTPGDGGAALVVKIDTPPTDHPAWTTSLDGSHYVLTPENGAINIIQFGAKPMIGTFDTMPAVGSDLDCYPAFVAADRFIRYVTDGGLKLIVPQSSTGYPWFLGRTHSLIRSSYTIEGGSSIGSVMIRTPPYESGFIVGGQWGPLDYGSADAGNSYAAGTAIIKRSDQVGHYNCYRCVVGGAIPGGTADTLTATANDPSATYTWGSTQWKFERYVGPGSVWDYESDGNSGIIMTFKNLMFHSFWQGQNFPGYPTGNFGGSTDPAFNKWPSMNLDVAGFPRYQVGIGMRSRCIVEECQFFSYNGFGLAAIANGDPEMPNWTGNVDGYDFRHIVSYYNGKAGIHVCGAIANAGSLWYADTHANGRMGIEDFSFLGNNWGPGCQSANDGQTLSAVKEYLSGCTYNGYAWYPRLYLKGVESLPNYINEEPGTTNAWTKYFGDGTATYGARGTVTGSISGNTLTVTATSLTNIAVTDMISSAAGGVRPGTRITAILTGTGGVGTYTVDGAAQTVSSRTMTVMLGGAFIFSPDMQPWDPTFHYEPGGAFGSANFNARCFWLGMYQEGGVNPGQPGPKDQVIGGLDQAVDFSRGAVVLGSDNSWSYVSTSQFGFSNVNTRLMAENLGGSPPAAGNVLGPFVNGDVIIDTSAGASAIWGFKCIASGNPGTWKAMGTLAA